MGKVAAWASGFDCLHRVLIQIEQCFDMLLILTTSCHTWQSIEACGEQGRLAWWLTISLRQQISRCGWETILGLYQACLLTSWIADPLVISPFIASLFRLLRCDNLLLLLVSVITEWRSEVSSFSPNSLLSCVNHKTLAFPLSSHKAILSSSYLVPPHRSLVIVIIMILVNHFRRFLV